MPFQLKVFPFHKHALNYVHVKSLCHSPYAHYIKSATIERVLCLLIMAIIILIAAHADYRCGSPTEGWSEMKTLKTLSTDEAFSPTFAVYGDFGLQNARSLPYLKREVLEGKINGVLHCGDIAYDLHEV